MTASLLQPQVSVRQRIAARTPAALRKLARMALNYPYRIRTWLGILASLRPVDGRSRKILWASAASAVLTSFRELDAFQKPMPLGDLEVDVAGIGRFAIRAGTDGMLHLLPAREQKVRETIEQRIRSGAVFIDGGANIGFYSILAARLAGPLGRVVAFEMMPDTTTVLRRHIAANGAPAIDLIKLDLEGAEYAALQGAAAVLARTACVVFESNERDQRIFDLLAGAGFIVEHLEGSDFLAQKAAR